jgi:steroid delta-isomerase-like uncharacterized protein
MVDDLDQRIRARVALVQEHVRRENAHDLPGIMATFGRSACYHDAPWGERHDGRDAVHGYYESLLRSLPDLHIGITQCLATEEGVVLEVIISGTHLGPWRGVPATGRPVSFPLCGIFSFNEDGSLAGERIYYDRASVLQQIGLYHDPQGLLGKLETLFAHPLTIAQAYLRRMIRSG